MDYEPFYKDLFKPVVKQFGPLDRNSIMAIIGFDLGGPLNFSTVGREKKKALITYISCELAVREDQRTGRIGPYELMTHCDDEQWVRSVISSVGRMTLDELFESAHTLDIGGWVKKSAPLQGIFFEEFACVRIKGKKHGILRCMGITRDEMEFAQSEGLGPLLMRLMKAGVYPNTMTRRKSVLRK
jgi:hypothetical protein